MTLGPDQRRTRMFDRGQHSLIRSSGLSTASCANLLLFLDWKEDLAHSWYMWYCSQQETAKMVKYAQGYRVGSVFQNRSAVELFERNLTAQREGDGRGYKCKSSRRIAE